MRPEQLNSCILLCVMLLETPISVFSQRRKVENGLKYLSDKKKMYFFTCLCSTHNKYMIYPEKLLKRY